MCGKASGLVGGDDGGGGGEMGGGAVNHSLLSVAMEAMDDAGFPSCNPGTVWLWYAQDHIAAPGRLITRRICPKKHPLDRAYRWGIVEME